MADDFEAMVEKLRELTASATPGPWAQGLAGTTPMAEVDYSAAFGFISVDPLRSDDGNEGRNDAALIVAMRNALPDLLAENARLREFAELIATASNIADAVPDVRALARQALDGADRD